jgi:antitoxin (DNA-binding transcriptional repressor) of toxin-antitoxin stability system
MNDVRAISSGEVISAESADEPFRVAIGLAADGKTRVVVTRDGKPVAAIVPIEDFDELEAIEDAHDAEAYREAMAAWEAEGRPPGVSHEEILARYGITPD